MLSFTDLLGLSICVHQQEEKNGLSLIQVRAVRPCRININLLVILPLTVLM